MSTTCDTCYDYNQPSVAPSYHHEPTINTFTSKQPVKFPGIECTL